MITFIFGILLQTVFAFLIGTVLFDIYHFFAHYCLKSTVPFFRLIGLLHLTHHRFYSSALQINKKYAKNNFFHHILIESCFHLVGILFCILFFNPIAVAMAALLEITIFTVVCFKRGMDSHHRPYTILPSYRNRVFVSAEYHALHHLYPSKYFSSYLLLLDRLLGTAHHLNDKRIAMTGASGALGSNMKKLLEKEGAIITAFKYGRDYTYDDYEQLKKTLENTDILLLCHGSKYENAEQANCDSFVKIIELFKSVRTPRLAPIEVWGVGSEIECHPCFGIKKIKVYARSKRHYAHHARRYYRDKDIQYRHLVHSAFISPMGPGLMTARFAAQVSLFMIKRGFRYVPVTYTGFAWLNYVRFVLNI
jgi:monoglucosyldiacylglycerol epimerase